MRRRHHVRTASAASKSVREAGAATARDATAETNRRAGALTVEERETLRVAVAARGFERPGAEMLVGIVAARGRSDVGGARQSRETSTGRRNTDGPVVIADGGTARSLDLAFDALSHPYRRRILLLVSEHNPRDEDEFSVEDLATEDDDLELLTTELYHAHLPKLAGAGYIEWDEDERTIRRGPNFDEIAPLLRLMHDHRDELPQGWP